MTRVFDTGADGDLRELDEAELAKFREALLRWFDYHRRDLPWRGHPDPYGVWVSEIMLQQTQVATVLGYYERWMDRFPTLEALAEADIDDVLELWAGLGYYRRARMLHQAAREVVEAHGGELPQTAEGLRALPGIGPYTAGAIASIAFGEATPLVDGNVARVLGRLWALDEDVKAGAGHRRVWTIAERLVDPERPGDFNQALMELGSLVCTPQNPACLLCPVREHCEAFATGEPARFPRPAVRTKPTAMAGRTCVVNAAGDTSRDLQFLVVRRPETGLLAGLWEFPTVERDGADVPPREALEQLIVEDLGIGALPATAAELGEVAHAFSHRRLTLVCEHRHIEGAAPPVVHERAKWVTAEELRVLPMSASMRKVERLLPPHDPKE